MNVEYMDMESGGGLMYNMAMQDKGMIHDRAGTEQAA
jgi:hypothetical protein